MNELRFLHLVVLGGIVIAGCGGQEPSAPMPAPPEPPLPAVQILPPPAPAPEPVVAPETPAPVSQPAPLAVETVEAQDVAPAMDPQALHRALIGTSWMVGDMQIKFLDESRVFAKGGMIAELSLEGITASYTFENGQITATAAGKTVLGAWDGQKLIFAGQEGVRPPS